MVLHPAAPCSEPAAREPGHSVNRLPTGIALHGYHVWAGRSSLAPGLADVTPEQASATAQLDLVRRARVDAGEPTAWTVVRWAGATPERAGGPSVSLAHCAIKSTRTSVPPFTRERLRAGRRGRHLSCRGDRGGPTELPLHPRRQTTHSPASGVERLVALRMTTGP